MSAAYALCREARRLAGLSQREFARRAGVPQSTVARIERGRMEPTFDLLTLLTESAGYELRTNLVPIDAADRPAPSDFSVRLHELKRLSAFRSHVTRSD